MRFNRKAAQRALERADYRGDASVIPFGLAFEASPTLQIGTGPIFRLGSKGDAAWDDVDSVSMAPVGCRDIMDASAHYLDWYALRPALKPRSLKKHELRKQARDLRRMKQYD
jgi:hypothetical protein